jgi:hypothetical protein
VRLDPAVPVGTVVFCFPAPLFLAGERMTQMRVVGGHRRIGLKHIPIASSVSILLNRIFIFNYEIVICEKPSVAVEDRARQFAAIPVI